MEQDEIIGLLRGFCVGDKVMVRPGEMRGCRQDGWGVASMWWGVWEIVGRDDTEPRFRIARNGEYIGSREWVFSDELTHYYEN